MGLVTNDLEPLKLSFLIYNKIWKKEFWGGEDIKLLEDKHCSASWNEELVYKGYGDFFLKKNAIGARSFYPSLEAPTATTLLLFKLQVM